MVINVLILIILEYIYINSWIGFVVPMFCLNPYYTGIHLHVRCSNLHGFSSVLILIILEYIYIGTVNLKEGESFICLNPYYTGIHLHRFSRSWRRQLRKVLILIILEYIYIYSVAKRFGYRECLNPYYTGIHLHLRLKRCSKKRIIVLILIILEYIYIGKGADIYRERVS